MKPIVTLQDARKLASQLQDKIGNRGKKVSLPDCWEILAQLHGYPTWDAWVAALKKPQIQIQQIVPQPQSPILQPKLNQLELAQRELTKAGRINNWENAPSLKNIFKSIVPYLNHPSLMDESPDYIIMDDFVYSLSGMYVRSHDMPPKDLIEMLKGREGLYFTLDPQNWEFLKIFGSTAPCTHIVESPEADQDAIMKVFGSLPGVCNCLKIVLWPKPLEINHSNPDTFWEDEDELIEYVKRSLYTAYSRQERNLSYSEFIKQNRLKG
jgi:hypothetical protein